MTEQRHSKHPSFAEVKTAALRSIDRVLARWLPGGKLVDANKEYTAPNPTRADKHTGSLKVNMRRGTWSDFATGDKGGDLIASVVMGFVGAGGLGQQIDLSLRMFAGGEVASMLLTFLLMVLLADALSRVLRGRLA